MATYLGKDISLQIKIAASRLYAKLQGLFDTGQTASSGQTGKPSSNFIQNLPISDYSKWYLQYHRQKLIYSLEVYGFILSSAIARSGKRPEELCIADNGGGTGLLCLLAREAGFKTVIYNDYYDVSCRDAQTIAIALGLEADVYVHGEIDSVAKYCNEKKIHCDIIASRNTIEHIYNLDDFFNVCGNEFPSPLVLCFATTANERNPLVHYFTKRLHRIAEYKGKKAEWGFKQMDSTEPFLKIREKIIQEHAGGFDMKLKTRLAYATRGLKKEDIIDAVERWKQTGTFPTPSAHPTNTCDPLTGNWEEHLVSLKEYRNLAEKNGFSFEALNGFYNTNYPIKLLNPITELINLIIRAVPASLGICAAPFVVIRNGKQLRTMKVQ